MNLSNNDLLLINSYFITHFLVELNNAQFLESEFYKNMQFKDRFVHEHLAKVGIANQGTLLIMLYTLLVLPRQLLEESFPQEFENLNGVIEDIALKKTSNYKKDYPKADHVRHLRNAVAHARVEFDNNVFIFRDENGYGDIWEVAISREKIGTLLESLKSIFAKYVESKKSGFSA